MNQFKIGMEPPTEVSVALHDSHGSDLLRANEGPHAANKRYLQSDFTPLPDGVYYRIVSGGRIIAGSTMIVSH